MAKTTKKVIKTLAGKKLQAQLKKLPAWSTNKAETQLTRTFNFNNHVDGLIAIARMTVYAEIKQHHPEIEFTYKKVKVTLTTHDAKGLTEKDIELAKLIDERVRG